MRVLIITLMLAWTVGRCPAQSQRVYSAPPGALEKAKARLAAGDNSLQPALDKLLADATKALKQKPASVMEKSRPAPSRDKHDYFSTAPYFWPNPNTTNGLPYIRKDGSRNPEASGAASDSGRMGKTANTSETLALAYYFTGEEKFAEHAARLLRVWFLDSDTRMNPHFNFAQAVPGVNTGRGTGMIESRSLTAACDAATLLRGSKAWSKADDEAFTKWMRGFLEWSRTSRNGRDEAAASNNHGLFYDVQVTHFALFLGETNIAREIVETAKTKRLAAQIEPDGSQPRELAREDSFGYSRFNVQAMFQLALLGEHVGVDLWRYESPKGANIRKALDFLVPYVEDMKTPWPYEHGKKAARTLGWIPRRAFSVYHDTRYLKLLEKDADTQRDALFFPLK